MENQVRHSAPSEKQGTDITAADAELLFSELEKKLEADISTQLSDLDLLEEQKAAIGNPDNLGKTILDVIWMQFINQIGTVAGQDFIKENNGMQLDLSYDAHVQTAENFANGKTPTHNTQTNYQERYNAWQNKMKKDDNSGQIVMHKTRTGQMEATLAKKARAPFDKARPKGTKESNTAIDHVVPAGKLIRDPSVNAFLSQEEQVAFANSQKNLFEMDARQNQSKSDLYTEDWLGYPNSKGQKPEEIFDITPQEKAKLLKKSKEAREELERLTEEGRQKAIAEGNQSRKEEALRIGGKALRSVVMGLLSVLIRKIIGKLIAWLKSKTRNFETLVKEIKNAIIDFFTDIKTNLITSADTMITTVIVSAVGDFFRKLWTFLKQSVRSVIEAVEYLKQPENKKKSVGILMLEVGKIITAGLTAAGAILLGEVIEKALLPIPGFAIPIPLIGSLASIIGMFLSGVITGIVGALIMSLIDSLIGKIQTQEITKLQIDKNSEIIASQEKMIFVKEKSYAVTRESVFEAIEARHAKAETVIKEALDHIFDSTELPETI